MTASNRLVKRGMKQFYLFGTHIGRLHGLNPLALHI